MKAYCYGSAFKKERVATTEWFFGVIVSKDPSSVRADVIATEQSQIMLRLGYYPAKFDCFEIDQNIAPMNREDT